MLYRGIPPSSHIGHSTYCCRMLRLVLVFLLVVLLVVTAIPKERYPNPILDPVGCWNHTTIRPSQLFFCDPDGLVGDDQAASLNQLLLQVRDESRCPCKTDTCHSHFARLTGQDYGFTISVAMVRSMDDKATDNVIPRAGEYANYLRSNRGYYGQGFTRCNDDIIIFLSLDEQVVYILTGYEARRVASDAELESMIMASHSRFGEVASGLDYLIREIKKELPMKS